MKHYWINIDRCVDRRAYMESQFEEKSIDNYRISAETPATIADYDIIRNEGSIETTTPEEISCILSHLKAIEQGYDDGDAYFCVLEDDLELAKIDFGKMQKYIEDFQNKNNAVIDILQLFTNGHPPVIQLYNEHFLKNEVIVKRHDAYPSTAYYLISREGARKILDKYVLSENKYDLSYSSWTAADNIIYAAADAYVLTYPIAVSDITFGSIIHPAHLQNHECCNNIIRHIWNVNNQLKMFEPS